MPRSLANGLWMCAVLASLVASSATAAPQAPPDTPLRAVRVHSRIVIDGRLDEPEWTEAPPASDFKQRDPDEGRPATERTEVRFAYDDSALYVGARLFDSEAVQIVRRLSRRDSDADSDTIAIYLDPRHDHLTGAVLKVSAAGSLSDSVIYNDSWTDSSWDAVWEAQVSVDEGGWTAEMRIPFSQLRFDGEERQTWGLNISRFIHRKNETDWWELVPKNESGLASRMRHLTGLDAIPSRRHLDLLPYATSRAEYVQPPAANDPFNNGRRIFGGAGVDAKWGVTSGVTIDATINPDFGQVEVDPAVVNLTAFETYYSEKRPFFIEGAQVFDNFGSSGTNSTWGFNSAIPALFYSRRIGRAPQGSAEGDFVDRPGSTTILGAAKVTGKKSRWTFGALDAVTSAEDASVVTGGLRSRVQVEPVSNYFVGRAQREIGRRASIGVIATSVARKLGTPDLRNALTARATVAGVDGHLFLDNARVWVVTGRLEGSSLDGSTAAITSLQESSLRYFQRPDVRHSRLDPSATSLSGWSGRLILNKNSGNVTVNSMLWGVSPGFDSNDVGFMWGGDRAGAHTVVTWRKPTPDGLTRSRSLWVSKWWTWNYDREIQGDGFMANASATFRNYWSAGGSASYNRATLDDRLTRGGPSMTRPAGWSASSWFETDGRRRLSADLNAWVSRNEFGGWGDEFAVSLSLKPVSSLKISTGPDLYRGRALAQYVTAVPDATATSTFGARYVFSDLSRTELSMSTRVNWIFSPKASLEVYAQPLLSTGRYLTFKELSRPRTFDLRRYGRDVGTLAYDAGSLTYTIDPDPQGGTAPFTLQNPDFNFKSLRFNAIFRWEWRLGSTLYVVWTERREADGDPGDFRLRRDMTHLFSAHPDNVFLVKFAYWLSS